MPKRKKKKKESILKKIKKGLRLKTKAPKVETPKTVYNRKAKHKRRLNEGSSSFMFPNTLLTFSSFFILIVFMPLSCSDNALLVDVKIKNGDS
mgnify:CR=1 FL=1